MKLGFGLYSHMLDKEHYAFARQAGATHIIAHLTDYFYKGDKDGEADQPLGNIERGWGFTEKKKIWSVEQLLSLKQKMAEYDLKLEALENLDPVFWYEVLLDGQEREQQIENLKELIRNMGLAGIPILGYNFSLAGVAGRIKGSFARGNALAVGMDGPSKDLETPIPNGMVWNMVYDREVQEGDLKTISHKELIRRYKSFLAEMIPVAEEANVLLALHPDDPPMKEIRKQPRLGYHPDHYKKIMGYNDSPQHVMELCLGTLGEMVDGDIYEAVDFFSSNNKIGYIHCRNIRGKVPYYKETFVDEGDIDMPRIFQILKKNNFKGVLIPDHAPQMSCDAPWHAGMAYAMGYLKAFLQMVNESNENS